MHIMTRALRFGTLLSRGFDVSGEEQSGFNVMKEAIRLLVQSKELKQLLYYSR